MKRKICIVLTTRGNYAKMKSTMLAARCHPQLELQVVVAGGILLPRYGDYAEIIEQDGFKIDRKVYFLVEGESLTAMTNSAGLATIEIGQTFDSLRPDLALVIADRYEALSIALAAVCMNVPIAHLEGGEVSGSIDERIRHAITKLAHVHFAANRESAERIRRLGEEVGSIFITGTPSLDLLREVDLTDLAVLERDRNLRGEAGAVDFNKDYLVVSQHPVVTEYSQSFEHLQETAGAIEELGMPAVWVWPNMDAGSEEIGHAIQRLSGQHKNIRHVKSLPMESYAVLLKNSQCLIGNSSSGIRECEFLGVPVVNVGTRQEGRQRGENVMDVTYDRAHIVSAARQQLAHGHYSSQYIYGDGHAGEKIAAVLAEYDLRLRKQITY